MAFPIAKELKELKLSNQQNKFSEKIFTNRKDTATNQKDAITKRSNVCRNKSCHQNMGMHQNPSPTHSPLSTTPKKLFLVSKKNPADFSLQKNKSLLLLPSSEDKTERTKFLFFLKHKASYNPDGGRRMQNWKECKTEKSATPAALPPLHHYCTPVEIRTTPLQITPPVKINPENQGS